MVTGPRRRRSGRAVNAGEVQASSIAVELHSDLSVRPAVQGGLGLHMVTRLVAAPDSFAESGRKHVWTGLPRSVAAEQLPGIRHSRSEVSWATARLASVGAVSGTGGAE